MPSPSDGAPDLSKVVFAISLPNRQSTKVLLPSNVTIGALHQAVTKRRSLDPETHVVRLELEGRGSVFPDSSQRIDEFGLVNAVCVDEVEQGTSPRHRTPDLLGADGHIPPLDPPLAPPRARSVSLLGRRNRRKSALEDEQKTLNTTESRNSMQSQASFQSNETCPESPRSTGGGGSSGGENRSSVASLSKGIAKRVLSFGTRSLFFEDEDEAAHSRPKSTPMMVAAPSAEDSKRRGYYSMDAYSVDDTEEMDKILDMMKCNLRPERSSVTGAEKLFVDTKSVGQHRRRRTRTSSIISSELNSPFVLDLPESSPPWPTLLVISSANESQYDVLQCDPETTFEEILDYICDRFNMDYDTHSLVLPLHYEPSEPVLVELDRPVTYYHQDKTLDWTFARLDSPGIRVSDETKQAVRSRTADIPMILRVVRNRKSYSVFSLKSDDDQDTLVVKLCSGRIEVVAGKPRLLLDYLSNPDELEDNLSASRDDMFMEVFLLTFRSVIEADDLLKDLVDRFHAGLSENATSEDEAFYNRYKVPSQLRILQITSTWVSQYWADFEVSPDLRERLEDFLTSLTRKEGFDDAVKTLRNIIMRQRRQWQEKHTHQKLKIARSKSLVDSMLLNLKPADIAEQVTLFDWDLYVQVEPLDYMGFVWGTGKKKGKDEEQKSNEGSPAAGIVGALSGPFVSSLDRFTGRVDVESYWIATEICNETNLKRRTQILHTTLQMAKFCMDLRNYFTSFAIYAALCMRPVDRLKKTWKNLPDDSRGVMARLQKLFDPSRNMKNYREALAFSRGPTVPFLPIFLKDLTFINDGNPKKVLNDLINVEKMRLLHRKIQDMQRLGAKRYPMSLNPAIQNFVKKPPVEKSMAKLEQMSEACE